MKITFKTRYIYNENVLTSACPKSEALFEILSPRKTLKPSELPWVAKMGFEIELLGDVKEFSKSEGKRHQLSGRDLS